MPVQAEIIQWSKGYIAGCDNPTERVDGTPLALEEIARVEYYIDPVDGNPAPLHTVIMTGGCTDTFIDTKIFPVGDYYRYAATFDIDGLISDMSGGEVMTLQKARPKSPGGIR
jgi:hypothetical protein